MSTDNRFMIRNLQKLEQFYTITSRATNLTWAQCDETTFDDQAYLFSREQDAADFCKALNEDNYPAVTVKVEKSQMSGFYTGLYLTGINRVVFHNGAGIAYLPLDQIVTLRKPEQSAKLPPRLQHGPAAHRNLFSAGASKARPGHERPRARKKAS